MFKIHKYPRTPHLEGSRLQPGDEDLSQIPFDDIKGRYLVIEEKCDGANSAVSFDPDGRLLLQSRGHYLTGGYRERHYNLMKQWANAHRDELYELLGTKYIMYGEWLYAKHTVFYGLIFILTIIHIAACPCIVIIFRFFRSRDATCAE